MYTYNIFIHMYIYNIYICIWYILISFLSHSTVTILPSSPSPPLSAVLPCLDQSSHLGRLVTGWLDVAFLSPNWLPKWINMPWQVRGHTHTTVLRTNPWQDGPTETKIRASSSFKTNLKTFSHSLCRIMLGAPELTPCLREVLTQPYASEGFAYAKLGMTRPSLKL